MNLTYWQRLKRAPRLLAMPVAEPVEQASRILSIQRNILLPIRCMVVIVVFYYLFYALAEPPASRSGNLLETMLYYLFSARAEKTASLPGNVLETVQHYFIFYISFNAFAAILLILRRFPAGLMQWVAFIIGLLDGLLLAGLTVETGGFESTLFWVFPGLIILNALTIPLATPQIVLNLALSGFYLGAGLLSASPWVSDPDIRGAPFAALRTVSPNFASFPFKDLRAFATRLDRHGEPVSQFLWQEFPDKLKREITAYVRTNSDSLTPQEDLVNELNRIIHRTESIYTPARFAGVPLSEESKAQMGRKLTGDRLAAMNRALLEDAYPAEILRKPSRKPVNSEFMNSGPPEPVAPEQEVGTEPYLLRLIILWLLTASCYGVQLLAFRDRQAEQEAREAAARNSELKAAGRLAAEIAHQLKNPLGIINNAIFSLQRGLRGSKHDFSEQIDIIKEEVERSDRIITQLMGYAQLSEGRVEKLSALEELDRALAEVFPPAASYTTQIHRDYRPGLPALVMQRSHLSAALVNLLQNAREAVNGAGNIHVSAQPQGGNTMEIIVADDGPGIPPDKLGKIFEAYVTSKSKGTGLGLAIVKHNVELYGGTVTVESKLGKGARFILLFPVRTFVI